MKIDGEHIFPGPRKEVWEMFLDPEVLASALPGTQKLTKLNENEYEGTMNVRIGPVSGAFSGKLVMSEVVEPESCTLTVDGKGGPGFGKGVGRVHFTQLEDGTTLLKYDGDLTVGGTLASVGQRMLDSVSKSLIRQGFETLDKALLARIAAKKGEEVTYVAPTETQFAASVAKDMTQSVMKTTEAKMLVVILPLIVILGILAYLFSR